MKNKLQILNKRPAASEKEISETMDFEQLLKASQQNEPQFPRSYYRVFVWGLGGILLLLSIGFFWTTQTEPQPITEKKMIETNNKAKPTQISDLPKEHDTQDLDSYIRDEPANSLSDKETKGRHILPPAAKRKNQKPSTAKNKVAKSASPIASAQYTFVEAKPKTGLKELYAFLNANLVYPETLAAEEIEGEVLVNFTINKIGNIVKVNIEKSLGKAFDDEAIRVINLMPPWSPATVNGTPVDSKLAIPLYFNLKK